jgi:hypothetical protein
MYRIWPSSPFIDIETMGAFAHQPFRAEEKTIGKSGGLDRHRRAAKKKADSLIESAG